MPSTPSHLKRREGLALSAILLLAFALRVYLLGNANLWWDEGLAVWAARKSLAGMTLWTAGDVHPPLYFWSLWVMIRLAGPTEFAARFISAVYGVLTIAAIYPLGKILGGQKVGLLAAFLLTISRFHVWWSQEMRMYILATLFAALSLYTLIRWIRSVGWLGDSEHRGQPTREALFYITSSVAGLYTLYLFVIVLFVENIFALAVYAHVDRARRTRFLLHWLLLQATVVLLFVPWLALALGRMASWSVATEFDFGVFLQLYATLLVLGISTYVERYTLFVVPVLLIAMAGLALMWRRDLRREELGISLPPRLGAILLGLPLAIPPLVVYVLTRPRGLFYAPRVEARYLLLFAPAFYILVARAVVLLWRMRRIVGLVTLAVVLALMLWTLPGHYEGRYLRDELQTMVRCIAAYAEEGDAVLLVSGSRFPIFLYYYERLPKDTPRLPVYEVPRTALIVTPDNVEQELAPIAVAHRRIWLASVNAALDDPDGLVAKWLGERYATALHLHFAHNALTLYNTNGALPRLSGTLQPLHPLSVEFGPDLRLLGYDLVTSEFRSGDTIRLALYWIGNTERLVRVTVVDDKGRVLEAEEASLLREVGAQRQEFDFEVFAATPPGAYHFEIGVLDREGAPVRDSLHIGEFRITHTKAVLFKGAVAHAVSANLGDEIEFLGYDLHAASGRALTAWMPGEQIVLDLYWCATAKTRTRYTVFTHLLGTAHNPATQGPVWGQHDSQPADGGYPTHQWFVGEAVMDRHILTIDPHAPSGDYQIEVGMYVLETGARLPVLDEDGNVMDDRVVLDTPVHVGIP